MQDILRVIDRLGSVGRLVVGGIAIATVAAVFYLVTSAAPAAYVPAFTNLTPRQAGDVQAALAAAKIPSKLGGTSDTVLVPGAQVDAARVAIDKSGPRPSTASTTATSCSTSSACRRPTSSRTWR